MDLTGEYEDRHFIVTRGDTRLSMTIGRNDHTAKFGRLSRFLIDDIKVKDKLAYALTKPLRISNHYDEENGVYKFVLQEVASTDNDNMELGIADYYLHFPRDGECMADDIAMKEPVINPDENKNENGKEVWL